MFLIMFLFRFVFFCLKLLSCCLFVMILQIKVGDSKMESLLERQLKNSAITRYLEKTTLTGDVEEFVQHSMLGQVNQQSEDLTKKIETGDEAKTKGKSSYPYPFNVLSQLVDSISL